METRTIKFNLKEFIQDFAYAEDSKDYDEALELLSKFDKFFYSSSLPVRAATINFIINNAVAMQYTGLQEITTRSQTFF